MATSKTIVVPWDKLEEVFQYEDAGMDGLIHSYLISRSRYSTDIKAKTILVYGPAGSGKTTLLIDIDKHNQKAGRRTCRSQLRSLQRLSDQIQTWGNFQKAHASRYVIDFWILVEVAKEFYGRVTTGENTEIRKIATEVGLIDRDPIEVAATWIKSNVDSLFNGIASILAVDPSTKALGKAAAAQLKDSNVVWLRA